MCLTYGKTTSAMIMLTLVYLSLNTINSVHKGPVGEWMECGCKEIHCGSRPYHLPPGPRRMKQKKKEEMKRKEEREEEQLERENNG